MICYHVHVYMRTSLVEALRFVGLSHCTVYIICYMYLFAVGASHYCCKGLMYSVLMTVSKQTIG